MVRESSFVITAASEVMALLALSRDYSDLRQRLGRIVVAERGDGSLVRAEELQVAGAMTALLRDALLPNLVQTIEGQPTLVHAGPFGNIAHANNSILADQMALKLSDLVITEAGFGSELGFEKFCHIVARFGQIQPAAAMLVATVRALRSHAGVPSSSGDVKALSMGLDNLRAHLDIVRAFGVECVVAINRFPDDTAAELDLVRQVALDSGARAVATHDGYIRGGAGSEELAAVVADVAQHGSAFKPLCPPQTPIEEQVTTIAERLYGAEGVDFSDLARRRLQQLESLGLDRLPVCIAKTPLSLSHDPTRKGRPTGYRLPVRDLKPSLGAGFVVVLCGDIQLMPGLGRQPAFTKIDVDPKGTISGLF